MADDSVDLGAQESVTMPNGVVLTGAGEQDADTTQEQFEQRYEERTGQPITQPEPTEPAEPRQTRGQKRFAELTAQREAEKRRADAAEARIKELESRQQPAPKIEEPAAPAQPERRPKPQESEIGSKYTSLSAYFEDLATWMAEDREAALRQEFDTRLREGIEADRVTRTRESNASRVFDAGRSAYKDFDAVLGTAEGILVPPSHQDAIWRMPNAEHILYAFGKNHDALKDFIAEKDPVMVGVRLATLVNGVPRTEAVASPASTPVAVRTTNAPAPPQPVGGGSRTAQTSSADVANSGGSYDAYKARRNAERGIH